jgi:hypothetical protein
MTGKHAASNQDVVAETIITRTEQLQRILPIIPVEWAMGYNAAIWDFAQDLGLADGNGVIHQ